MDFTRKDLRERENDVKRVGDTFFRKIFCLFPVLLEKERYGSKTFSKNPRRTNPKCFQSRPSYKPSRYTRSRNGVHGLSVNDDIAEVA